MSGQAFYWSTILDFVALVWTILTSTNAYWDEAPMLFVIGLKKIIAESDDGIGLKVDARCMLTQGIERS